MRPPLVQDSGLVRHLGPEDLIVTKTDLKGRITYCNRVFLEISALTEKQALGAPHNLIRHPDMPRGVFRLLWTSLNAGQELFALIANRALDGATYWVLAHVTPTFDASGVAVGYHSMRRAPKRAAVEHAKEVYQQMRHIESAHKGRGSDAASLDWLTQTLAERGQTYSQWLWDLEGASA